MKLKKKKKKKKRKEIKKKKKEKEKNAKREDKGEKENNAKKNRRETLVFLFFSSFLPSLIALSQCSALPPLTCLCLSCVSFFVFCFLFISANAKTRVLSAVLTFSGWFLPLLQHPIPRTSIIEE
eukprot:TRINITY_DN6834_c0_g1_i3.p3 TRINITY_DN6834_c0_g1~~TRINITY_DN6834_c0_g1_i3.p3  ORF type:complete len:124 (+),score=13.25 TRINITY_DN6834_c0_g1_i3:687-1058(+)